jgi:hypothetical protein
LVLLCSTMLMESWTQKLLKKCGDLADRGKGSFAIQSGRPSTSERWTLGICSCMCSQLEDCPRLGWLSW